jgi:uncharacterized protein YegJ (DUF2314 family)
MRASLSILILLTFVSCSKKPQNLPSSFESPMAPSMRFEFAVYLLPGSHKDPAAALRQALAAQHAKVKLVTDQLPNEPQEPLLYAHLNKNAQQDYPPPSMKSLRYHGQAITGEQGRALQKCEQVYILDFAHPRQYVWSALRTANLLVEEVARKTGGLVWDDETREVFTPDAWHKVRLSVWTENIQPAGSQITIHVYNNGEYARAITLGMAKMGLPDVVVEELPWSSRNQVGHLINAFCQVMAEGAMFEKSGKFNLDFHTIKNADVREPQLKSLGESGSGKACLLLKAGKGDEGDPDNRLIELASDRYKGSDAQARQDSMISSLFGAEDSISHIHHSQQLLDASAQARAKLPGLEKTFNAGLEPGEYIQVKAPFNTPNGNREWMWVEVTSWKEHKIKGLLQNEPVEVPDLHGGQVVEVREEDVFDYLRTYPDKHQEGNTTGEIIKKMDEAKGTEKKVALNQASATCD